ncbi:MAG: hypothetical protein HZY73_12425 [Micropruina sp.]|nr:MAG: hypothetical protein HZY73_12425 [Micropruina sp.]
MADSAETYRDRYRSVIQHYLGHKVSECSVGLKVELDSGLVVLIEDRYAVEDPEYLSASALFVIPDLPAPMLEAAANRVTRRVKVAKAIFRRKAVTLHAQTITSA